MPSPPHEVLIVALREHPALLRALVTKLTGGSLARGYHPVDAAVRFVKTAEIRLDLVLQKSPKEWVIVELQRAVDPAKSRRWLLAASLLFDQTGTLGDLIVITASRAVGRWAARVAQVETPLGTKLALTPVVLVLGPEQVDALLDPQQPELALFAAWAMHHRHGSKAQAVVERAIELTKRLPSSLQHSQMGAIVSVLSEPMLALLRKVIMNPGKFPERPALRSLRLFLEEQGREKWLAEGRAKGVAEGVAEGVARGKQEALITLLEARGVPISSSERAAIRVSRDLDLLDRWIALAATATSMEDLRRSAAKAAPRTRGKHTATPRATTPRKPARTVKP